MNGIQVHMYHYFEYIYYIYTMTSFHCKRHSIIEFKNVNHLPFKRNPEFG